MNKKLKYIKLFEDFEEIDPYGEENWNEDLPEPEHTVDPIFRNYYRCVNCNTEWVDEWDCMCDDRCPECGTSMSPYHSENI